MSFEERGVIFDCEGESLVGVVSIPQRARTDIGVLVIVGGPQYRAGSHRQFVQLCRALAGRGIACMRFDYRGMGDATGEAQPFDRVHADIRAALSAFANAAPQVTRFVLWGLCDGASAACLYAAEDERVAGLVLLNPWVRTETTRAKTYLRHYYLARLFDRAFWRKLLGGRVKLREIADGITTMRRAANGAPQGEPTELPSRMAACVQTRAAPVLIVLSEKDFVAREFEDVARSNGMWRDVLDRSEVFRLADADHTFSRAEWKTSVADKSGAWVMALQ